MRILDENGNELQSFDEHLGCTTTESIVFKHHDAVVSYDGKTWTSLIDNNVWMPGVSQWTKKEEV